MPEPNSSDGEPSCGPPGPLLDQDGPARSARQKLRGPAILVVGLLLGAVIVGATYLARDQLAGCPSLAETPGGAVAANLPVLSPSGVSLRSASFRVDTSASPAIVTLAGQLMGSLPAGLHVWIVEQPSVETHDSTPEHKSGNGMLYPVEVVKLDGNGCWSITYTLGYVGIQGITFVDYVALVDDQTRIRE